MIRSFSFFFKRYLRAPLARGLLTLIAYLPLPWSRKIGGILGWVMASTNNEMRRVSQLNIANCLPTLSKKQQASLVKQSLMESGKGLAEMGAVWCWPTNKLIRLVDQVTGEHYVKQALGQGNGVILALPHLGNWELMGAFLGYHYQVTGMARPLRMASLNVLVVKARVRHGGHLVATDVMGVRSLYQTLSRGGMVGILPDQEPSMGRGLFAPFFGIEAKTAVLIPRLIEKTQATVILGYALRHPSGQGFHIHFRPAFSIISEGDLCATTTKLNHHIESCISAFPEQYIWSYRRFRSRPEGAVSFYHKNLNV